MTVERQNRSLNYFNSFAVKDRVDLSKYSSSRNEIPQEVDIEALLPSIEKHSKLHERLCILVSRILVDNIPVFKFYFEDVMEHHILHEYYEEMKKKSEVVNIIILKPKIILYRLH